MGEHTTYTCDCCHALVSRKQELQRLALYTGTGLSHYGSVELFSVDYCEECFKALKGDIAKRTDEIRAAKEAKDMERQKAAESTSKLEEIVYQIATEACEDYNQ